MHKSFSGLMDNFAKCLKLSFGNSEKPIIMENSMTFVFVQNLVYVII